MEYTRTDTGETLQIIRNIDSRIARYELAQRITGPEDFYGEQIGTLRRERRGVINDFGATE